FNEAAGRILGVDLGRSHLTIVAADLAANVLARHSGPFNCDLGPDVCLPQLVSELGAFAAASGIDWDAVVGLGLGIPGPLDAEQRMLVAPPRMPGWGGVDILSQLRHALKVPIYLGNDANMGARGESRFGAGRGLSDFAYVKVGTGIGCGLVIAGDIYRGSRGSAGELGHVTIDEDGPVCDCGNRGCLETMAAAPQIVADALGGFSLRRALGADAPLFTGSSTLADRRDVDVADVVLAAQHGDAACRAAVERAGELIGVALASLVNLFSPSVILLDGSVARAGDLVLDPVRRALVARSLPAASAGVRIVTGALGDNAIALGAVAAVIDAAFGPP
ncbi:MAG: ROK family protein, partial [Ktedonobacterales bacterium]